MESDWTPLDMQATLGELFAKTVDFEPENPPAEHGSDCGALYPRVLPPDEFELLGAPAEALPRRVLGR